MEQIDEPLKPNHLLRRALIGLAWVATLIALCYGWSDWSGAHAWNEYRTRFEAHTASLDLKTYIPKEIPADDNFAATPTATAWITQRSATNQLYNVDHYSKVSDLVGKLGEQSRERRFEDLAAWQQAFAAGASGVKPAARHFSTGQLDAASRRNAAPAVLAALSDDQNTFDELRAASARSGSRYPIVYDLDDPWAILLPHLAKIKQTCLRLHLKACAELALDQTQNAFDDVTLAIYLGDTMKSEPFLISYLVRVACMQITTLTIWEGLQEHRWNEAQLKQLQDRFESYDFLTDVQTPLNSENAATVLTVDLLKKKGAGLLATFGDMSPSNKQGSSLPDELTLNFLGRVAPSGWYAEEKLHVCAGHEAMFKGVFDLSTKQIFPAMAEANKIPQRTPADVFLHHYALEQMILPALGKIVLRTASAQTAANEAATACALERYYLANRQYPEELQALAPKFIAQVPNDVIGGEPLKYKRTDDSHFVLYSVGWNQKDDGGHVGASRFDDAGGDWVW